MATESAAQRVKDVLAGEPFALYVHWPFCVSKCPYCDFNSHVRAAIDQEAWRDALLADLAHEARLLPGRTLTSIFFGGGTPSLMDPATVAAVIDSARELWPAAGDIEITLEANPNSVEAARFADLAAAGVNRLSLGLQSFDDARPRFPRPRAFGARGPGRAGNRAEPFRARQLRPHLCLARRHGGQLVGDACPGAWRSARRTCRSTS